MIISRAPLRISFVGGGTDLPRYASKYGGEVISGAIDKYVYVTVNHKFDGKISLRYSKTECVDKINDLKHDIVRECLRYMKIKGGIEIVTISDVPMRGSGLGSSSALTVALLIALAKYKGKTYSKRDIANMACEIEIDILKAPIGKQDQFASAVGGFNHFIFRKDGRVYINKLMQTTNALTSVGDEVFIFDLKIDDKKIWWLESNTLLFYLNKERKANDILKEQGQRIDLMAGVYHDMKKCIGYMLQWLQGKYSDTFIGNIIGLSWNYKKTMCLKVTHDWIDDIYERAKKAGATGGKVCGAGGGGFLMLIVSPDKHKSVRRALKNLKELPFTFNYLGAEVIYEDK